MGGDVHDRRCFSIHPLQQWQRVLELPPVNRFRESLN